MYKASVEIARINQDMKLKFNLILKDDDVKYMKNNKPKVIDKFNYNGSQYLKINPIQYVTVDISKTADRGDAWNSNMQVNLNKVGLFKLRRRLKEMIDSFQIKDLYFIKNKKLHINPQISSKYRQSFISCNKTIFMTHAVIQDKENQEIEYEGICFMINSVDNFCCLTYEELEYFYYELSQINMHNLGLFVIMTDLLLSNQTTYNSPRELVIPKVMEEVKVDEVVEKSAPLNKPPNTIPDI